MWLVFFASMDTFLSSYLLSFFLSNTYIRTFSPLVSTSQWMSINLFEYFYIHINSSLPNKNYYTISSLSMYLDNENINFTLSPPLLSIFLLLYLLFLFLFFIFPFLSLLSSPYLSLFFFLSFPSFSSCFSPLFLSSPFPPSFSSILPLRCPIN